MLSNPNLRILLLCLFSFNPFGEMEAQLLAENIPGHSHRLHSDQVIIDRLNVIPNNLIHHRFNPTVRSYINTYTVKNRARCEAMLGKMSLYFPLFERVLSEANLPLELKYLAIVESALDPNARSRSGAVGLWQFMPPTAGDFGLKIRSTIDDRKNPEKATKSAVKYLGRLYDKFGSWELALAAYNGGPGRVARAVRRAGTSDYWELKKFIPKETRNYVAAYIGASYVANYYHMHDLNPKEVEPKLLHTSSVNITEGISFSKVAESTGLPMKWIKLLNPQYLKSNIPISSKGHTLNLPSLEAELIRNAYTAMPHRNFHLEKWNNKAEYQRLDYEVLPGDNLRSISAAFNCSMEDIVKWNRLTSMGLYSGRRIVVFNKKAIRESRNWKAIPVLGNKENNRIYQPARKVDLKVQEHHTLLVGETDKRNPRVIKKGKDRYYILKRGESLSDVARQFPKVSLNDLLLMNDIKINDNLNPGQKLKVK